MSDFCLYFLGFFLPFVPVTMRRGCGADLLINLAMCILGWLPGVIHCWYIISHSKKLENPA